MKKRLSLKIILVFASLMVMQFISGQEMEETYQRSIANQKDLTEKQSDDIVINVDMIEKFYKTYEEVEVLPWTEILSKSDFSEVKLYLSAYNNLDKDELGKDNLSQEMDIKVIKIKDEIATGLTQPHSFVSNDDIDENSIIQNF